MAFDSAAMSVLLVLALVLPPSTLLALILRKAHAPGGPAGAAIAAGIAAALLIGPGVLGRTHPEFHRAVFVGGAAESRQLDELLARQRADRAALQASGVTEDAVVELEQAHVREREPLIRARDDARRHHRQRLDLVLGAIAGIHAALAGLLVLPATSAHWRRVARELVRQGGRPLLAGIGLLLVAAVPAVVLPAFVGGVGWKGSLAWGLVFGVPGAAAVMRATALAASGMAAVVALSLALLLGWSLAMTMTGAGTFLGFMVVLGVSHRHLRALRRAARGILFTITLPSMLALAGATIEPQTISSAPAFWIAMFIAVFWSSDGRWLAGAIAHRFLKRNGSEPARASWLWSAQIVNGGSGSMQIILALLLHGAGLVGHEVVAAAAIGAWLIELTVGVRTRLARLLDQRADS